MSQHVLFVCAQNLLPPTFFFAAVFCEPLRKDSPHKGGTGASDNQISLLILMFDRYVALSSSVNLTELLKGQCVPCVYCHSHLCPTERRIEHNKVKSHRCRSSVLGWVLSETIHSPSPRFLAIKQAQQ